MATALRVYEQKKRNYRFHGPSMQLLLKAAFLVNKFKTQSITFLHAHTSSSPYHEEKELTYFNILTYAISDFEA